VRGILSILAGFEPGGKETGANKCRKLLQVGNNPQLPAACKGDHSPMIARK
jgi:hypothetical protein